MSEGPQPRASLAERDAQVIAKIGKLRFSPLSLCGGRELLDLSASFGPAVLGYGHPAITAAVSAASANMAGASLLAFPNENAVRLAETLLRITPGAGDRRVWFGHSGPDANDCAMRVVQAATGRTRFISFIGSYHGNLSGSMSISGHTAMTHTLPRAGLLLLPYGRLHCFEHEGLTPDLVIFGKALGGGLPLSAVVGAREIMDHAGAFALQTTGGNPIATAAGLAVLQAIDEFDLGARAQTIGARFVAGLRGLSARHAMIGDVRGRGLAVGVELVLDRDSREPVPVATTAKVIYRAYQLGAVFFYVGLKGNVLEFTPPLTLTEAEADEGVAIIDQAMADADVAPFMMW